MSNEEKHVEELENELKVLKNEIKETLVGIRDFLLTYPENPFSNFDQRGPAAVVSPAFPSSPEANGTSGGELPADTPPSVSVDSEPALPIPSTTTEGDIGMSATEPQGVPMEDLPAEQSSSHSNGEHGFNPVNGNGNGAYQARWPAPGDMPANSPHQPMEQAGGQADLATVAMLAPWLEDCLPRLGRTRVRALVKLYAEMGSLSPECKSTILQLIELDGHAPPKAKVALRESLRALAELDAIIVRSRYDRTGAAILAVYLNSMAKASSDQATPQV